MRMSGAHNLAVFIKDANENSPDASLNVCVPSIGGSIVVMYMRRYDFQVHEHVRVITLAREKKHGEMHVAV